MYIIPEASQKLFLYVFRPVYDAGFRGFYGFLCHRVLQGLSAYVCVRVENLRFCLIELSTGALQIPVIILARV